MSAINSVEVLCRKCIDEDIDMYELTKYLDSYISSLPDYERVPDSIYEQRLSICTECAFRMNLTCTKCGCYVQARCAKRRMKCPSDIGTPKWDAYSEEDI